MNKSMKISLLVLIACGWLSLYSLFPYEEQEADLSAILDNIATQMESHAKDENWIVSVSSTVSRMDKNWNPQKVTLVEKKAIVTNGETTSEIIRASETEKGVSRDITEKYRKETNERTAKYKKERYEQKLKGKKDGGDGRPELELTEEGFIPFSAKNRPNYDFSLLPEAVLDGQPVYVVIAKPKVKKETYFEGNFFISKVTFDVLRAEIKPSKNPRFVRELEIHVDFMLLPGNHFVLKKSRIRINGGFFLKHIRMIAEEVYSDYQVPGGQ